MTLNKAFKDVYCKFLTEQGYQWCSKLQRFVKVVNQELIYFIGLKIIKINYINIIKILQKQQNYLKIVIKNIWKSFYIGYFQKNKNNQ